MIYSKFDDFFNFIFKDLNGKFDFKVLITLFIGVLLGMLIASTIYGIMLLASLKKTKKKHNIDILKSKCDEEINILVKNIKNEFIDNTNTFTIPEKFKILGSTVFNTIQNIASIYYPNSKRPIFELTINEFMQLNHYITNRIDEVFDNTLLKNFKNMSISSILRLVDYYKRFQENKAVKTIKQTKGVRKVVFSILNYANPVYWIKKLLISGTINQAASKMCLIIIDIVACETVKVYSKRIFNEETKLLENSIVETIKEMEDLA